jgi:hypothetical protein
MLISFGAVILFIYFQSQLLKTSENDFRWSKIGGVLVEWR